MHERARAELEQQAEEKARTQAVVDGSQMQT